MKRTGILLLLALLTMLPCTLTAQKKKAYSLSEREKKTHAVMDSLRQADPTIIIKTIPNLHINDNVVVINRTNDLIMQTAIAYVDEYGLLQQLGMTGSLPSGQKMKVASFSNNRLKNLRLRPLFMKIKGVKTAANASEPNAEEIRYDYKVNFSEIRHDLYIEIMNNDFMDF